MNSVRFNPTTQVSFQANNQLNYKSEKGRAQNAAFVDSIQQWEGKKSGGAVKKTLGAAALLALAAVVLHKVPAKAIPKNKIGNVVRGAKLHLEKFIQKYLPKAKAVANQAVEKGKVIVDDVTTKGKDIINKGKEAVSKTPPVA